MEAAIDQAEVVVQYSSDEPRVGDSCKIATPPEISMNFRKSDVSDPNGLDGVCNGNQDSHVFTHGEPAIGFWEGQDIMLFLQLFEMRDGSSTHSEDFLKVVGVPYAPLPSSEGCTSFVPNQIEYAELGDIPVHIPSVQVLPLA